MAASAVSGASSLATTISQVAAKNPTVGNAVAKENVDAAILGSQAVDAPTSETDPTLQILGAANAHLGQNLNIKA
jgi:hypothetical protein